MEEPRLSFGPFVLRPERELRRGGQPVPLGQRGLKILEALVTAGGEVVSKADLMAKAWPGTIVEDGNITVQIAALRKELGTRSDGSDWVVTVPRIGYRLALPALSEAGTTHAESGKPTLAVLPFVNLSGDSSRDYFADGIVEDLITAFGRFKSFAVVSRNSTFAYKGRAIDVRQVARELGVRYVLEGSIRLAGEHVRVTVQLVDATTGTHHWASNLDGELGQIFQFQDRITEAVVGLVEPQMRRIEIERTRRQWPENPRAYDHLLRALPHFYSRDPAFYLVALGHLEEAIALEPDYALALAYASWAYARRGTVSLEMLSSEDAARCLELARAALRLGDDDPMVLAICAHSLLAIGNVKSEGLSIARRALSANPHNVAVLVLVGICNMLAGDLDEAETCYRRAYQLSPGALEASESLAGIGFARFFKGDYEGAIEWLEQSRASQAEWPPTYWMLAAAYAHLGRETQARAAVERLLTFAPHTTLAGMNTIAVRSDERFAALVEGLRRAGLN